MQDTPLIMESPPGPETVIDGRRYVYFGGTSYLGLAGHPEVCEAACAAVRRYGVHTATSRNGYGHNPLTLEVERRAAEFFGVEDAFYFASGYVSNHILLQALSNRVRGVFIDEGAHYSLHEAARLVDKPITQFQHRNPEDLARRLHEQLHAGQRPLVLSDGVFPVSGAIAPVREYLQVLQHYKPAILHLDDAHSLAVLGEHGRGVLEHCGLWDARVNSGIAVEGITLTVCGTLAKAIGGFGGIIPGSREFLRVVRAATHYYDGASAPSSADAGATAKALEIVQRESGLRDQLRRNIQQLRAGLRELKLPVTDDPTANFSVEIGEAERMREIHIQLKAAGFIVPYVNTYSGVGPHGALRFAVCAQHTPDMIRRLLSEFGSML